MPGNLKRIPQSVVRYDITVTNSGPGTVDANTLVITDPIPANTAMYVATTPGNPVVFVNGTQHGEWTDLQLRDQCAVFVHRRQRTVGLHARCRTPTASMRRCARCASRRAAR